MSDYRRAHRLGTRLRELRKITGLTQEELAERLGCHPSLISLMEAGRRPTALEPDFLGRLADALRLDRAEEEELFVHAGFVPPTEGTPDEFPKTLTTDEASGLRRAD